MAALANPPAVGLKRLWQFYSTAIVDNKWKSGYDLATNTKQMMVLNVCKLELSWYCSVQIYCLFKVNSLIVWKMLVCFRELCDLLCCSLWWFRSVRVYELNDILSKLMCDPWAVFCVIWVNNVRGCGVCIVGRSWEIFWHFSSLLPVTWWCSWMANHFPVIPAVALWGGRTKCFPLGSWGCM